MPAGPEWKCETITLPDAQKEPQTFFYRHIVECAQWLLGTPSFRGHMEYAPATIKNADGERIYYEMNHGNIWHEQQVSYLGLLALVFDLYLSLNPNS